MYVGKRRRKQREWKGMKKKMLKLSIKDNRGSEVNFLFLGI